MQWVAPPSLLLVFSLLALPNRGYAQQDSTPPPAYELEVGAALDDHEAGRFEAARDHLLRAHAVFPSARTLRGLGKVEFELGRYVDALQYLEAALGSEIRPLPPDLRDEVGGLIERARDSVGELWIDVKPASAQIAVDGNAVASGPRTRLVLAEGVHVLDFQAAGRLAQRRQVDVHGRDQLTLTVALLAAEATQSSPSVQALALPPQHDVPLRRRWWVWTLSGVALAGAATAAVLLATRDHTPRTRPVQPGADWTVASP